MARPVSISATELRAIFKKMGLYLIYDAGPFCVFANPVKDNDPITLQISWEHQVSDIEWLLDKHDLSMKAFWEHFDSLF